MAMGMSLDYEGTADASSGPPLQQRWGLDYSGTADASRSVFGARIGPLPADPMTGPDPDNPMILRPGGGAANNAAMLLRAQWSDYKARFDPVYREAMRQTTYGNPDLKGETVADALQSVDDAFGRARALDSSRLKGLGMRRTAEEQSVYDRMTDLSRSQERVDAAERAGMRLHDRDREIALGGIPNAGRSYGQ